MMNNWRLNRKRRSRDYKKQRHPALCWFIVLVLVAIFIFCAFQLGSYVGAFLASKKNSGDMQKINEQLIAPTAAPATAVPVQTPPESTQTPLPASPTPAGLIDITATQNAGKDSLLPVKYYPKNKYAQVSNRFRELQQTSRDLIGWLNIEGVVNEGVVQRDNTYYLTRDYQGRQNINGAIFLDESCELKTRPYTLTLYGHNMKIGAMFGFMRHYEQLSFYQQHPFITFDTAYENGEYVIFSIATVSTRSYDSDYLDLAKLNASTISWRQDVINFLKRKSIFTSIVDVQPDDQILLMMTCVADDTERQVIAARRIRDGESKDQLQAVINRVRAR